MRGENTWPLIRRSTFDHLLAQARLADGSALSVEVAGGRPPETPFRLEVIGEAAYRRRDGVITAANSKVGCGLACVRAAMEIVATGFGDLDVLKTVKTDFCLPSLCPGKHQSTSLERTAMTARPNYASFLASPLWWLDLECALGCILVLQS